MTRSPLAAEYIVAPGIEPRRGNRPPDILLLHYTGMESAAAACAWLCNPASGVSCHYLVDEAGRITQMVGEEMRAWHAGQSAWNGETDINSRSIGIEIHNPGHTLAYADFPAAQMRAVIALCRDIVGRHAIAPRNVLAHSDVAPLRKIDPGEKFDWAWLHREGVGHWVPPVETSGGPYLQPGDRGRTVEALQAMLVLYGYGLAITGEYDRLTEAVVSAFQRHFRQARVDGVADRSTIDTLHRLLSAL
jgi:N-acetylmuramoyl-L-alanine amidase